jgi:hypothetical protein
MTTLLLTVGSFLLREMPEVIDYFKSLRDAGKTEPDPQALAELEVSIAARRAARARVDGPGR